MISTDRNLESGAERVRPAGAADVHASLPRTLWNAWKAYSHRAATYQGELLLSIVYLLVLGPSGLVARALGKQLLDLGTKPRESYWIARKRAENTVSALERQF